MRVTDHAPLSCGRLPGRTLTEAYAHHPQTTSYYPSPTTHGALAKCTDHMCCCERALRVIESRSIAGKTAFVHRKSHPGRITVGWQRVLFVRSHMHFQEFIRYANHFVGFEVFRTKANQIRIINLYIDLRIGIGFNNKTRSLMMMDLIAWRQNASTIYQISIIADLIALNGKTEIRI